MKDIVRSFSASNIPLSKLNKDGLLRKLFDKYMVLDGEKVAVVDPKNLRGTWLGKIWQEGIRKLSDLIRDGDWFVVLGTDETNDPGSNNDYIVTINVRPNLVFL